LRIAQGDDQAFHQADDDRSHDDAPERSQAADHDHDEGRRYNLAAHGRVDREDRREHDAG
jgi:hypothetical protein